MSTQKQGTIGVTTENIFPVIKKFLYSDHEIFLRELVSNAVDATQKLKTLASFGDFKGKTDDLKVRVTIDKEKGTLTVSDNGIGMTRDEIDKYINQIAFSGAEEFLAKFKDTANTIIGHFGLGFYSAFMVAKKVEIITRSYKDDAQAVRWECDGSPVYSMDDAERAEHGTDIILYIDDDDKEFLEQARIDALLKKYCRFLPVPVESDGKIINATQPLWTKKPADLTDDDYREFYRELYPGQEDPLFWIHLNVDYPFTLTGILFFPKIKNNLDIRKDRIQLYCNQVYVTDSVEGVVPEFMMLLQGVIDSPDIPLNVSRSYLQSDTAVKKISGYITKKVADRLDWLFKDNRADFEKKWDDIRLFIQYGMLTDPKFCDAAMKFVLLKDTEGKYFSPEEYKDLTAAEQTDKDGTLVWLYATDPVAQYTYIKDANAHGYNVLLLDGQLDTHFVGLLEQKLDKTRLVRVDSDTVDRIIDKGLTKDTGLTPDEVDVFSTMFRSVVPTLPKSEFFVSFEALNAEANPVLITTQEYMRRMKDMAATQAGMSFYDQMPDMYSMIVNVHNPLVAKILDEARKDLLPKTDPLSKQLADADEKLKALADKKDAADKDADEGEKKHLQEEMTHLRAEREKAVKEYAANQPLAKQVVDLALLANGLLKGQPLSDFISRSVALLKSPFPNIC